MRWFPEEEDGLKDMFVRYMGALPKSMMVSTTIVMGHTAYLMTQQEMTQQDMTQQIIE
jgi:hypothetical protein